MNRVLLICIAAVSGCGVSVVARSLSDHEHEEHDHHHDGEETSRHWGEAVGACTVVWACVFIGVITLGGKYLTVSLDGADMIKWVNMFASGALLGTAFTLTLPEASHLMEDKYEEGEAAGYWGALVLVGFVTSLIIDMVRELITDIVATPKSTPENSAHIADAEIVMEKKITELTTQEKVVVMGDEELGNKKKEAIMAEKQTAKKLQYRIISAAIVGDFFHNFCDGIFIGAAFKTCSLSLAWAVASSTVFHELAQEVSDFLVFTQRGGLSVMSALIVNALCGLSVILGGIIISVQSMDDATIGLLLAFGAGNYIYLGATELFPIIHDFNLKEKAMGLVLFAVGAIAVGLVLLHHEHC